MKILGLAKHLYLDPLSYTYRKQLKGFQEVGYVIEEPFNHVYYKKFKNRGGKELSTAYYGAIKLTHKE